MALYTPCMYNMYGLGPYVQYTIPDDGRTSPHFGARFLVALLFMPPPCQRQQGEEKHKRSPCSITTSTMSPRSKKKKVRKLDSSKLRSIERLLMDWKGVERLLYVKRWRIARFWSRRLPTRSRRPRTSRHPRSTAPPRTRRKTGGGKGLAHCY